MSARDRCAVCGHQRWLHWLTFQRFYAESPVQQFVRALDRALRARG